MMQTQGTPAERNLFLSYSREDSDDATLIVNILTSAGYSVYRDTSSVEAGEVWIDTIPAAITNAAVVIVLVTPSSNASKWVKRECIYAERLNKQILPIVAKCALPIHLTDLQSIPYNSDPGFELALLRAVSQSVDRAAQSLGSNRESASDKWRQRYLSRQLLKFEVWLERYTPLSAISEGSNSILGTAAPHVVSATAIEQRFELFLKNADAQVREHSIRIFERTNILDEITKSMDSDWPARIVILGEPGAGKTTTLMRLMAELTAKALHDSSEPWPLYAELKEYSGQTIDQFFQATIDGAGEVAPIKIHQYIRDRNVVLLLDGLNEIAHRHREQFMNQLRLLIANHPTLSAYFTCREIDYDDFRLDVDRIRIRPLDVFQVSDFIDKSLGDRSATRDMMLNIAGSASQLYWDRFSNRISERDFWLLVSKPTQLTWHDPWDEWVSIRDNPSSILSLCRNPFMLFMTTRIYLRYGKIPDSKGQLYKIFIEFLFQRELDAWRSDRAPPSLELAFSSLADFCV
jgi:hypothetical protein